jgi:hypothetical protein
MQFMENLSDRQAADAVRARIDWKYVLSLCLASRCTVGTNLAVSVYGIETSDRIDFSLMNSPTVSMLPLPLKGGFVFTIK